jgi:hypothetical protein
MIRRLLLDLTSHSLRQRVKRQSKLIIGPSLTSSSSEDELALSRKNEVTNLVDQMVNSTVEPLEKKVDSEFASKS